MSQLIGTIIITGHNGPTQPHLAIDWPTIKRLTFDLTAIATTTRLEKENDIFAFSNNADLQCRVLFCIAYNNSSFQSHTWML